MRCNNFIVSQLEIEIIHVSSFINNHKILEAIKGSKLLEIKASAEAQDALDGKAAIAALPDSIILSTRIRGVENPLA